MVNSRLHPRRAGLCSLPPLFVPARHPDFTPLSIPLFSSTYALPNLQVLCFDDVATMGVGGGGPCLSTFSSLPSSFCSFLYPFHFQMFPHSLAQWSTCNLFPFNHLRTLSHAMGGWGRVDHELLPQRTVGAAQSGAACPNDSLLSPPARLRHNPPRKTDGQFGFGRAWQAIETRGGFGERTIDEWRGGRSSRTGVEFYGAAGRIPDIHLCERKP